MAIIVNIQFKDKKHRVKVTDKPFIVGRSSKCHLCIKDDLISGQHITIQLDDEKTVVKDLNSTNGTFINGSKIDHTTLLIGEEIIIGNCVLSLDVDSLNSFEKKTHRNTRGKTSIQFVSLPDEKKNQAKQTTDIPKKDLGNITVNFDHSKSASHIPSMPEDNKISIATKIKYRSNYR